MKKKIIITVCMAMTVLTGLAQSPLSFHAKLESVPPIFMGNTPAVTPK